MNPLHDTSSIEYAEHQAGHDDPRAGEWAFEAEMERKAECESWQAESDDESE